jgi:hypothetical protein
MAQPWHLYSLQTTGMGKQRDVINEYFKDGPFITTYHSASLIILKFTVRNE